MQSLFVQIDCQTLLGQWDDALLRLLYNTGMRAQELVDLDVNHLRFSHPYSVRIYGKGRKERTCPLWKEPKDAVKKYLERRSVRFADVGPLFVNVEGDRLSRFGFRYIIAHRVAEAAKSSPTLLTRRVSPHTVRPTTPMHLLQSNVDLNMIRSWLGNASIETTSAYVEIDLEMKRKTLQSCGNCCPKARARPILATQQRHPVMVVEAVVMCSGSIKHPPTQMTEQEIEHPAEQATENPWDIFNDHPTNIHCHFAPATNTT